MIAFRVSVNGNCPVVASQPDWSVLSAIVSASRDNGPRGAEDYISVSLGGLSNASNRDFSEHFRWPETNLDVGDKIEIEIIDTQHPSEPAKRYRSDRQTQESPYTEEEWREMRYKDYLKLKAEFEGDSGP